MYDKVAVRGVLLDTSVYGLENLISINDEINKISFTTRRPFKVDDPLHK